MLGRVLSNLDSDIKHSFDAILNSENVKRFFADEELENTVNVFLLNDLNIISASKVLGIHRNTMIYRLEKVKKLLGLDIKKFEDAVTVQIIMHIKEMDKKKKRVAKRSSKPITIQSLN